MFKKNKWIKKSVIRKKMSVISDMSTEQETEVFSPNFVSAGRCRGGPHGVG